MDTLSVLAMNWKTRPLCDAGAIARECNCPSAERVTSIPNLVSLMMFFNSAILCGVSEGQSNGREEVTTSCRGLRRRDGGRRTFPGGKRRPEPLRCTGRWVPLF